MKLSDSHKISQEKRDFKISDVLITAGVGVRAPHGPPYSSYSNPILYENGFGYVFCLSEVCVCDSNKHPSGVFEQQNGLR